MPMGFRHPDLGNVWKAQVEISSLKNRLWIGRRGETWKRLYIDKSENGLEQNHT